MAQQDSQAAGSGNKVAAAPPLQHGINWRGEDLTGWYLTEKFNGCRAYWDGRQLWSRNGLPIKATQGMLALLPPHALDCELYDGPDGLNRCVAAVLHGRVTETMRLMVFDAPDMTGDQKQRLAACGVAQPLEWAAVLPVPLFTAASTANAMSLLATVLDRGGEGLMCSQPGKGYARTRVASLLKLKATAIEHALEGGAA